MSDWKKGYVNSSPPILLQLWLLCDSCCKHKHELTHTCLLLLLLLLLWFCRRLSDWKKAYVIFKAPQDKLEEWQQQKQQQQELWQVAEKQQQLQQQRQQADRAWRKEVNWRELTAEQRQQRLQEREQQQQTLTPEEEADKSLLERRFTEQERAIIKQQLLQRKLDGWQQQVQNARQGVLERPAAAAAARQGQRKQLRQGQQQLTQGSKSR
jgi:hypothetical protein